MNLLLVPLAALCLAPQEIPWKKTWPEALKEAKAQKKLAVLVFFNDGVKDWKRFQGEALKDTMVLGALRKNVCALIDPEGSDEDNKLWQKMGERRPPMTFIFDPDGVLLAEVGTLNPKQYAAAVDAAGPAYFDKIVPAKAALASNPKQADKLAMLGDAYARLGSPAESAKNYEKAADVLAEKGDKAGALKILEGQLDQYYDVKWYPHARGCCKRILDLEPSATSKVGGKAALVQGMAEMEDRKYANAIPILRDAAGKYKDPEIHAKTLVVLGTAHMYGKDTPSALAIFDEIMKKYPDTDQATIAKNFAEKLRK